MALCYSPSCSRGVVISFNLLFCVTGGGLILLGFWVLLDTAKSHILHLLLAEDRARLVILVLSYLLLLLGCSMVGLVFLGCYALQSRPNLILLYLCLLVVLECLELVAVMVTLSTRESVMTGLQSRLSADLTSNYGHKNSNNINTHGNNVFTQDMDYAQYMLQCCGVVGSDDYHMSRWFNNSELTKEPRNVPITCCTRIDYEENSAGSPISVVSRVFHGTVEEIWQNPRVQRENDCQEDKAGARYIRGCLEPIQEWFRTESYYFIIVLAIPMTEQMACIVCLINLLKYLRQGMVQAPAGSPAAD